MNYYNEVCNSQKKIKTINSEKEAGHWEIALKHAALDGEFAAGASVTISFQFTCNLFAGMYFLNTGLMGEVQGTDTYLHRLVDAVAFRVANDASRKQSGYVDFHIEAALVAGDAVASA